MQTAAFQTEPEPDITLHRMAVRCFVVFSMLMLASVGIYVLSLSFGAKMADGGHSPSTDIHRITVGTDVFSVPENLIRFAEARTSGPTGRLDLYLHWPSRSGYSRDRAGEFNTTAPGKSEIIFLTIIPRERFLDMRDRFGPIYTKAMTGEGKSVLDGLTVRKLKPELGFSDELLVYAKASTSPDDASFVARCHQDTAQPLVAACELELFIGQSSEMRVRFPSHMLSGWKTLQQDIARFAEDLRSDG